MTNMRYATVVFSISLQLCDILAIVQVSKWHKHFSDAAAVQSAPTPLSPNVKTFQFSELSLGSSCAEWTWEMNIDWKNGNKISRKCLLRIAMPSFPSVHRCIWLFYCWNPLWDTFANWVTLLLSHKSWEANIRNRLFPVTSLSSVPSEGVASLIKDVHLPSETVP